MHEWTRDLWAIAKTKGCTAEDFDRYLTSSLTKKAEELRNTLPPYESDDIRKILGLEACAHKFEDHTQVPPIATSWCQKCGDGLPEEIKVDKEKWCEHIRWESSNAYPDKYYWFLNLILNGNKIKCGQDWNNCPICAAPRPPKKKTLAEVLRNDALQCRWQWDQINGEQFWDRVAMKATEFFKNE